MKKVILSALSLALLTVASCSDDDSSANVPGSGEDNIITEGKIDFTAVTALTKPTWQNKSLSDAVLGETLGNVSLTADKTISGKVALTGVYAVKSGATLTIEAGTEIVVTKGAKVYIVVEQGGKININGTEDNPVLMSSSAAAAGDWGGLIICGEAVTTAGVGEKTEVDDNLLYGGTKSDDNSGSISYLIIKGAGNFINPDAQFNGITFYAVGSGTEVNNIAVIDGDDDGVEFFGGSVNVTDIYLKDNSDDSVDWTEGYDGTVKNIYIEHTKAFSTAFEGDGTNKNPTFENVTAKTTTSGIGFQFKKGSGATLKSLNLDGYSPEVQFRDEDQFEIEGVTVDGGTLVIL